MLLVRVLFQCHFWDDFVISSLVLLSGHFRLRFSCFPPSLETNISEFQLDLHRGPAQSQPQFMWLSSLNVVLCFSARLFT